MNWKRWKLSAGIALFCGLLTAGAGLTGSMDWKSFIAVLCMALSTNFFNFLAKHPVESITEEDKTAKPGTIASNLSTLLFIVGIWFAPGCTTEHRGGADTSTNAPPEVSTADQIFSPDHVAAVVKIAARDGVAIELHQQPDTRVYFVSAVIALETLLADRNVDPQQVRETLAQLTDGQADAPEWLAVSSALEAYEIFFGDVVARKLDTNKYVTPVLKAFADGIASALQAIPGK